MKLKMLDWGSNQFPDIWTLSVITQVLSTVTAEVLVANMNKQFESDMPSFRNVHDVCRAKKIPSQNCLLQTNCMEDFSRFGV